MKTLKLVFSVLVLIITLVFISILVYDGITTTEITKVTLKCEEKVLAVTGQPEEINFYKITKHLIGDEPVSLYISAPDTDKNGFPPYLIGLSDTDLRVKNKNFEKKYFLPEYFTFVTYEDVPDRKPTRLDIVTYLNRSTLEIKSFFDDNKVWSSGTCVVVDDSVFNDDLSRKTKSIKNKLKI